MKSGRCWSHELAEISAAEGRRRAGRGTEQRGEDLEVGERGGEPSQAADLDGHGPGGGE